jgi:lysophospholipid acyltransferase (LPLAT)-like uncharacterized protein
MRRKLVRRLTHCRAFQNALGTFGADYLRFVWATSRVVTDPPSIHDAIEPYLPFIFAMWHGQHFLAPMVPLDRPNHRSKVLISRHRDAEINAITAQKLGIGTIRGSGDQSGRFDRKGGVGAFVAMVDALREGYTMAMTADVPKVARVAGEGIVRLAAASGRPLIAVALASSRRIELKTWDRAALNLPFSRIALVGGPPNLVPADADAATLEHYRLKLEADLNAATKRAYAIADGRVTPKPTSEAGLWYNE